MKPHSPFVSLISTLTEKEFKVFGRYLDSPLSLPYQQPKLLYGYLKERFQLWHGALHSGRNQLKQVFADVPSLATLFSKQEIHACLFPGQEYNDDRMRRIISLTSRTLEQFLVSEALGNDRFALDQQALLLRSFVDRGDLHCLQLFARKYNRGKEQGTDPETDLFEWRRQVARTEAGLRANAHTEVDLQAINDALDRFYLASKLKFFSSMRSEEARAGKELYEYTFFEAIRSYAKGAEVSPLIKAYGLVQDLQLGNEAVGWDALLDHLEANRDLISRYELRQLTGFLLVQMDRSRNVSGKGTRRKIFVLLHEVYASGEAMVEGRLPLFWFHQMAISALGQHELEWLEDFLYAVEDKLIGPNASEVWELYLLRLTLALGAYQKVIAHLESHRSKLPVIHVRQRNLWLKAQLEVVFATEDEASHQGLEAFRNEVRALTAYVKAKPEGLGVRLQQAELEYLKHLGILGKLAWKMVPPTPEQRQEIESANYSSYEQIWVREKLDQITRMFG